MIDSEYQPELNDNTSSFPWPPRDGDSAIDALATTWKESVFHPTEFFRRMPREFDFGWVLGYYLIIGVAAGGASLFWHMVFGPPTFLARIFPAMFEAAAVRNPVVDFLLSPLWLVFFLFFMGGVYHVCLKMVGGAKVLRQPISREDALIAHTRRNAFLVFQENNLGSLQAGRLADLVVLDRDYLTIPADQIKDIQPVMTMVGGRIVYEDGK